VIVSYLVHFSNSFHSSIVISPCTKDPLVQPSHLQLHLRRLDFRGVLVCPLSASLFREVSAARLCFKDLCGVLVYPVPASRFREVSAARLCFKDLRGVLVYPVPASRFSAALLCFKDLHRVSFIVKYFDSYVQKGNASFGGYVFPCYLIRFFYTMLMLSVPHLNFNELFWLIFLYIEREDFFRHNFLGCMPSFLSIFSTNPPLFGLQRPEIISNNIIVSDHGVMHTYPRGGGSRYEFRFDAIERYLLPGCNITKENAFVFVDHVDSTAHLSYSVDKHFVHASIPLENIVSFLPVRMLLKIAKLHRIPIGTHVPKSQIISSFDNHSCVSCNLYHSVFSVVDSKSLKAKNRMRALRHNLNESHKPPSVPESFDKKLE
jgi:hypothetical protein